MNIKNSRATNQTIPASMAALPSPRKRYNSSFVVSFCVFDIAPPSRAAAASSDFAFCKTRILGNQTPVSQVIQVRKELSKVPIFYSLIDWDFIDDNFLLLSHSMSSTGTKDHHRVSRVIFSQEWEHRGRRTQHTGRKLVLVSVDSTTSHTGWLANIPSNSVRQLLL